MVKASAAALRRARKQIERAIIQFLSKMASWFILPGSSAYDLWGIKYRAGTPAVRRVWRSRPILCRPDFDLLNLCNLRNLWTRGYLISMTYLPRYSFVSSRLAVVTVSGLGCLTLSSFLAAHSPSFSPAWL